MNNKIVLIIFVLILLGLNGCPKKRARPVSRKPIEEEEIVVPKKIEEKRRVRYTYGGKRFKDPFAPPEDMGGGIERVGRGVEIDLSRLKLTGIMISPSSKDNYALVDAGGGRGYVIKSGKLIDNYNRVVDGVVAIVRKDKVILITRNNVIRELRLTTEK